MSIFYLAFCSNFQRFVVLASTKAALQSIKSLSIYFEEKDAKSDTFLLFSVRALFTLFRLRSPFAPMPSYASNSPTVSAHCRRLSTGPRFTPQPERHFANT